jgi:fibronectin-binding autotransporter adhesin
VSGRPQRARRIACLFAGTLCFALAAVGIVLSQVPAQADVPLGSGFGRFNLSATAVGTQLTYDFPGASAHPQAEGEVPITQAQLHSGPQGYALSSITWPGPLAANAGSLAVLLGLPISPEQAGSANYPVRAEARTGSGPSTVTNTTYPGSTMTATATDTSVQAGATMAGSGGPSPDSSTGSTETDTVTRLTGANTAEALASSTVRGVDLGGVVTIGSVTSTAGGTTDGVTGTAKGGNVVADMKIGGQPAYVDHDGLHVGSAGAPANPAANAIANQALSAAGMTITVSQPTQQVDGANVSYDAGNIVVLWKPADGNGDTFVYTFGGASVGLASAPAFGASGAGETLPSPLPPGSPGTGQGASLPSNLAGSAAPASIGPGAAAGPARVPLAASPIVASPANRMVLPKGLAPVLPIVVVLGSALIGFGLRRLPDRVLEHQATMCTREGDG